MRNPTFKTLRLKFTYEVKIMQSMPILQIESNDSVVILIYKVQYPEDD